MQNKESQKNYNKLLLCPFCGGEAEITINKTRQGQTSVVRCTKCTCRKTLLKYPFYEGDIYADAVKDWNTRKPMQNIVELLEEQAEECRKYWQEFDDEDSFGGMNAYCYAVKIVKEEGGLNE